MIAAAIVPECPCRSRDRCRREGVPKFCSAGARKRASRRLHLGRLRERVNEESSVSHTANANVEAGARARRQGHPPHLLGRQAVMGVLASDARSGWSLPLRARCGVGDGEHQRDPIRRRTSAKPSVQPDRTLLIAIRPRSRSTRPPAADESSPRRLFCVAARLCSRWDARPRGRVHIPKTGGTSIHRALFDADCCCLRAARASASRPGTSALRPTVS